MSRDDGFTMIELLIVLVILGILTLAAAPSYLGFKDRAMKNAAAANVRNAAEAAQLYFQDNQSYVSMTSAALLGYNRSLPTIALTHLTATSYCIASTVGVWTAFKGGPNAAIAYTPC